MGEASDTSTRSGVGFSSSRPLVYPLPPSSASGPAMPTSQARRKRRGQMMVSCITAKSVKEANPDVQIQGPPNKGRGLFWCPSDGKVLVKDEESCT